MVAKAGPRGKSRNTLGGHASTNRRNFIAGGAALFATSAANARARFGSEIVTPEQFGAVADLSGNGGTDNTVAFRRMGDYLNRTGAHAVLAGRYRITQGFAIFAGTLEFRDDALVRNTGTQDDGFWAPTCLFLGSYFGLATTSGLNAEDHYYVLPIEAGADRFSFFGGGAPKSYVPGSLVYLKDALRYPGAGHDVRRASHVSVIEAVEGSTVIMRDPSPLTIGGEGLELPTVLTPSHRVRIGARLGVPVRRAALARGVRVINGAFESPQESMGRGQTVHVACHDCELDFRYLSGNNLLGINPCSDTSISLRDGAATSKIMELAYFHARVRCDVINATRVAGQSGGGVPPVAIHEYGHSATIDKVSVVDKSTKQRKGVPVVGLYTPHARINQMEIATNAGVGVIAGRLGTRANGAQLGKIAVRGAEIGLAIDTNDISVNHVELAGPQGARPVAVVIKSTAGQNVTIQSALCSYEGIRDERV